MCRARSRRVSGKQDIHRRADQLTHEFWIVAGLFSDAEFDDDVLAFDITKFFESLPEGRQSIGLGICVGYITKHGLLRNCVSRTASVYAGERYVEERNRGRCSS